MTKTDLVNYIAEETGLSKADAARALEAVITGVTAGLKKEGKVTVTGFATFAAKRKKQLQDVIQELVKQLIFLLKLLLQLKLALN